MGGLGNLKPFVAFPCAGCCEDPGWAFGPGIRRRGWDVRVGGGWRRFAVPLALRWEKLL